MSWQVGDISYGILGTLTLPIEKSQEGLPIGLQVHGKRWSDKRLLDISELIVQVIGGFEKPNGF